MTPADMPIATVQHPWEMEKSKVEIYEEYDAQIVDDEGEDYAIKFFDYDGSVVEASLPKQEFKDLPYPRAKGTHFWVVVYRIKEQSGITVSVWPVAKYWHSSRQEENNDSTNTSSLPSVSRSGRC